MFEIHARAISLTLLGLALVGCSSHRTATRAEAPPKSTAVPTAEVESQPTAAPSEPPALPPPRAKPAIASIPDLDPSRIAEAEKQAALVDTLEDGAHRRRLIAASLENLEKDRLPPGALAMLRSLSAVSLDPNHVVSVIVTEVSKSLLPGWNQACDGGWLDGGWILGSVIAKSIPVRPKLTMIYGACRLDNAGLIKGEKLTADQAALVGAHAIWGHLRAGGKTAAVERRLLRAWLTAGDPLAEPISAAELKAAFDDSPPLEAAALAGVRARIREGVRLLESKDDAAFFKALVLPFKASAFRTDGDRAFLLARMREGAKHRWAAEADANVAVYYPRSSTVTLTPRPLELELVDGVWYLRRY